MPELGWIAPHTIPFGTVEGHLDSDTGFLFDPVNRQITIDGVSFTATAITPGNASSSGFTEGDILIANASGQIVSSTTVVIDTSGHATILDAKNVILGTTTGTKIGTAVGQKLGFHNATPVVQRAGAAQAAVAGTAATNTTPYGYTQAQADGIIVLLNEIRAALVEKGIIKGAA